MENISKYSYSRKISKSRNHGNVEEAITIALEAKERYPEENIFEKFALNNKSLQTTQNKAHFVHYP